MGGSGSTPSPPACPEFDKPWRTMPWGINYLENKLRDFRLNQPNVQFVRILLVGDVGAGKSSFINSVNNAFQKRITSGALTNIAASGESFTKTYETHCIKGEDGFLLPFAFNDVMGLQTNEAGATTQDLIRALHGCIPEGYNFEKASSSCLQDSGYRSKPSLEEQTFCVVNIIAADKVSRMNDSVINKMKIIREAAAELKLPQVIIMTRPDLACPLVKGDHTKIYTSKKIKEKMETCSNLLGIPMSHIFPVKNYHEEMETDDDTDALIFKALDYTVNMACDALKKKSSTSGDKPTEFEKPWRAMPWGKNDLEKKLRDFRLNQPNVQFVRILLVGEVGAGKSSFINSVNNAFQKRITSGALANTAACGGSFTKTYETHYIEGEDGSPLPFAFNDVMGLQTNEAGATTQDLKRALHGYLPEGYSFEKASSSSGQDSGYRSNPSLEEQTFCMVNIIAADKVSMMNNLVIKNMKNIREAAAELKLPQVIIMTRPDLACPLVKGDLRKIYTSKKIKEKMETCHTLLGIPMSHIFPVKNYHEEMDTDDDTDALIFKALDQIVNIACDALKKKSSNSGDKPK